MNLTSMGLAWIVVNDLKQAIEFYTKTVGLKLMEHHEEYGWAELEGGSGGARLGIAQNCSKGEDDVKPGQNAVVTFTVKNLEKAIEEMTEKGARLIGEVQVVPGHVKMQMSQDSDGNRFQLVELIQHSCAHC